MRSVSEYKECPMCGETVKYLGAHVKKHVAGKLVSSVPPAQTGAAPHQTRTEVRKYLSPKARRLVLVVRPVYQRLVDTPVGAQNVRSEGKSVVFENGEFSTDDPEIINFLDNVYKDPRHPVVSVKSALENRREFISNQIRGETASTR